MSTATFVLYRELWHFAAGARLRLAAAFALLVGSQLVKLAVPFLAAQAIDALQEGHGVAPAWPWVAAIVSACVASWALHGPGRVVERKVAVRVRKAFTDRLWRHLSAAPLAWHDRHHPAELEHRMSQSGRALFDFTQSQFVYLQSAVNLIGPLVALTLLAPSLGLLALTGFAVVGAAMVAFDRTLVRLARSETEAERRYGAVLLDCLSNIQTVLSLGLAPSTRRTLARRLDAVNEPLARSIVVTEWKWCVVDLATVVLVWLLVGAFAWQASDTGALLLGSVFMVHQYAQQAGGVVGALASNLQGLTHMGADFANGDLIRAAPSSEGAPRADASPWRQIEVRDLHFTRPASAADAGDGRRGGLHGASLTLRRGGRVALVGPSGSGKSTLLRVLAGLYAPERGHLEIDGVVPLGVRTLADRATLIPQEAQVFEGTVRENLAFDLPLDDASLLAAARVAGFDSVLATLPGGLDAPVAAGGANLSGGQRQRLCLARGVLAARGRAVLLLDEPTSALDPLSEALVMKRIGEAFPDACVVASVHRMGLLAHFDTVVLMDDGAVVDSGSAEELLARQPLFARLVRGPEGVQPPGETLFG